MSIFRVSNPGRMFRTMALSTAVYAFVLGPWVAIGLIIMIFIHEMGHVAALRLQGREVSAPIFIPFFGAIILGQPMERRDDEAFMAFGGPLLGSLGAILVFGAWTFVEDKQGQLAQVLLQVSMIGVVINLFNLIPVSPLDGGRITQAISPWFLYLGIAFLLWLSAAVSAPVVWLLWLILLPGIAIIPQKVRFILSVVAWAVMSTQLVLGLGAESWIIRSVQLIMGLLLVFVNRNPKIDAMLAVDNARPHLPMIQRVLWFVCYVTLIWILATTMMWIAPFLKPVPAQ